MTKPTVRGKVDGNVFAVLAAAKEALRAEGMGAQAEDMIHRAIRAGSYEDALVIVMEYVDFDLGDAQQ